MPRRNRSATGAVVLLSTGACSLAGVTAVHAQTAASGEGSGSRLDEVIVTAQRRSEKLEDVPISITALSAEDLSNAGSNSFRDLEKFSPGTRISGIGVFTQPAIRGISSTAVGPGVENNVAVYIDGFYQPDNAALGSDLANVRDVQVLKGPQGTLYGRNALAGALLINTLEPSSERLIAETDLSYGSRNDVRARAFFGVPLGETVSLGVAGYYRENDGYIDNTDGSDAAPLENYETRVKLKIQPSSDLLVVLGGNHMYKKDGRALAYNMFANAYLSGYTLPPIGPSRAVGRDQFSGNLNPDFHVEQNEGTLKVQWTTALGTLSSYTSYVDSKPAFDSDYDGTRIPFQRVSSEFQRTSWIESADYTMTPTERLTLVVGGLYYQDDANSHTHSYGPTSLPPTPPTSEAVVLESRTRMKSEAYAGFIDATWEVVDSLFLNAGVRYSHETKDVTARHVRNLSNGRVPFLNVPWKDVSFSDVTPRAVVRYELSPATNVYASYSQGFKSGTFNSIGSTPSSYERPVDPEEIDAYEVGFKTARGAVRFDTSAYFYDYTNLQVSSLLTSPVTGIVATVLSNAATARIYGADMSVAASLTERLNTRLAVAHTHARYEDFRNASATIVCTPPGGSSRNSSSYIVGCPVGGPVVGTPISEDFSDRRMARAPDWTVSLGADYTIPIGASSLLLAANAYYASESAPTVETYDPVTGEPRFYQGEYVIGSASVKWTAADQRLSVGAYVENVADKRIKITHTSNNQGDYTVYNEPRTVSVRVGYKY